MVVRHWEIERVILPEQSDFLISLFTRLNDHFKEIIETFFINVPDRTELGCSSRSKMETTVQAIRIGDAGIVGFPGEVFADTGRRATDQLQAKPLFTVSLANDYIGYICTDTALQEEGGYETWAANTSLGGVGTEPAMLAAAERAWDDSKP